MTNKIRVKLWRIENVVLMKVLEMPEELRGTKSFYSSPVTNMTLWSEDKPDLLSNIVSLMGDDTNFDNIITYYDCKSNEDALVYYNRVVKTIEEFNNKNKKKAKIDDNIIDIYVTD